MTGEVERTIVQPAADAGKDGRAHRLLYIGAVAVLLGIAYLAWQFVVQQQQIGALRDSGSITADQANLLANQVRSLGATPVVQPAAAGQTGATGATGTAGINGRDGANGKDGATPACLATTQQCQGAAGTNGQDGQSGKDGVDGRDGANGKDGQDGKPGIDGTNGADGQPPSSWTTTYPDGSTQTCTRDSNFDPSAPTYTCAVQSPTNPTPTTPAVLPGVVTLNRRRT